MREAKKRKVHTPEFKAKVGLEALRGVKTIKAHSSPAKPSPGCSNVNAS